MADNDDPTHAEQIAKVLIESPEIDVPVYTAEGPRIVGPPIQCADPLTLDQECVFICERQRGHEGPHLMASEDGEGRTYRIEWEQ